MSFYPYNSAVPNAPDDPADDQPEMLQNTQSINDILTQDHVSFNDAQGGIHKQVRINANQDPAPSFAPGVAALYANNPAAIDGNSWPFWVNSIGSQLQVGPSQSASPGYIYIGPFLIQWGFSKTTDTAFPANPAVTFPKAFGANPFSVVCSVAQSSDDGFVVQVVSVSTTQFTVTTRKTSGGKIDNVTYDWIAIGSRP